MDAIRHNASAAPWPTPPLCSAAWGRSARSGAQNSREGGASSTKAWCQRVSKTFSVNLDRWNSMVYDLTLRLGLKTGRRSARIKRVPTSVLPGLHIRVPSQAQGRTAQGNCCYQRLMFISCTIAIICIPWQLCEGWRDSGRHFFWIQYFAEAPTLEQRSPRATSGSANMRRYVFVESRRLAVLTRY